jgi:hypothetical protein
MKRRIILSIALVSAVLISLTAFNLPVAAQQRKFFVADSGVRNLGANQKLRVIAATASDNQSFGIRFRRCTFVEQNGVLAFNSGQISPIMMLPSNEARFFDIFPEAGISAVRARVGSNRADFVVTLQLIDTSTGEIVWADEAVVTEQDVWATAN